MRKLLIAGMTPRARLTKQAALMSPLMESKNYHIVTSLMQRRNLTDRRVILEDSEGVIVQMATLPVVVDRTKLFITHT